MESAGIPEECPVSFSQHIATSELHICSFGDSWFSVLVFEPTSTTFTKHLLCALFYCVL